MRASYVIALGAAVAAGVALGVALFRLWPPPAGTAPSLAPLAIVPPGPAFVLSVDLGRLRQSAVGHGLVDRGLAELGSEPCSGLLARNVDEVVLVMPADANLDGPGTDAFALIARGSFRADAVTACAEGRIRARHGDPVRTGIGSFTSVRDRRGAVEVAARDGLVVQSEGAYFRQLLDGAEGHRAEGSALERERDHRHAELRRVVGRGAPVIATLALESGWLGHAMGDPEAEKSPIATLRSAALRVELGAGLELTGVLACDTSGSAERFERFLGDARAALPELLPAPSAAELARIVVARDGARLDVSARFTPDDVAKLWPAVASAGGR